MSSGRIAAPAVRQLEREHHRGEGSPHHATDHAGQADELPEAGGRLRQHVRPEGAERGTDHEHRGQDPSRGAGAERERPDQRLHDQDPHDQGSRGLASEQLADHVVADAERPRLDEPAEADDQPADRRPPHPVDGQAGEAVLGGVDEAGEQDPRHARRPGPRRHSRRARAPMDGIAGPLTANTAAVAQDLPADAAWPWPPLWPPGSCSAGAIRTGAVRPPAGLRPAGR